MGVVLNDFVILHFRCTSDLKQIGPNKLPQNDIVQILLTEIENLKDIVRKLTTEQKIMKDKLKEHDIQLQRPSTSNAASRTKLMESLVSQPPKQLQTSHKQNVLDESTQ